MATSYKTIWFTYEETFSTPASDQVRCSLEMEYWIYNLSTLLFHSLRSYDILKKKMF